jgi:hypothetical protein
VWTACPQQSQVCVIKFAQGRTRPASITRRTCRRSATAGSVENGGTRGPHAAHMFVYGISYSLHCTLAFALAHQERSTSDDGVVAVVAAKQRR